MITLFLLDIIWYFLNYSTKFSCFCFSSINLFIISITRIYSKTLLFLFFFSFFFLYENPLSTKNENVLKNETLISKKKNKKKNAKRWTQLQFSGFQWTNTISSIKQVEYNAIQFPSLKLFILFYFVQHCEVIYTAHNIIIYHQRLYWKYKTFAKNEQHIPKACKIWWERKEQKERKGKKVAATQQQNQFVER